jgi:FAD-dependent urate hydroxylase
VKHTRTALVVGGGIAGPAVAFALRKAGIDASVYEAHPSGADGAGAFLTLASNGIEGLRVLGVDAGVLAAGFPTPAITLRSGTGKRLGETRTGGTLPDGTTSQTIKRADLYRVLHQEAATRGIAIEHGKRLVKAEETNDGVRIVFADGSEAAGDILIGCDGVHSTVRRIIDVDAPAPTYAGLLNTGGFTRDVAVERAPGTYEMIFGKRAFFGYVKAPDGEVWWFANVPHREDPARNGAVNLSAETWRPRLLELYPDDEGAAVELVARTADFMALTPIHTLAHLPRWHRGRMIVVGDAAHAPSPSSGQGASLAVEDALVLAQCLRDESTAAAAFARFEALRRERVERIIKWAKRMNNAKAPGPIGRRLRDLMMPALLRMTADSKAHRRIYDHHITWHDHPRRDRARAPR